MNEEIKGYLFAFGASLALAVSFIFSKAALTEISMYIFGLTWFGAGAVFNTGYLLTGNFRKKLHYGTPGALSLSLVIAILEGLATVMFYVAIQRMENPAVVSFIGNIGPVLVSLFGIVLLHERYNRWQLAGIIMTIIGVFMITFNYNAGLESIFQPGSEYVLLASFLFACATLIARWRKDVLKPELMSTLRSYMLFFVFLAIILFNDIKIEIHTGIWKNILLGSLLETLITIVFAYQALRFLEAARTSLVISTKAIWLVFLSWIFFDTFPAGYELAGGMLSLLGIFLISIRKNHRSSRM